MLEKKVQETYRDTGRRYIMSVYCTFRTHFFKQEVAELGYKSIRAFCEDNGLTYRTICNTVYKKCLSIKTICQLALIFNCSIDDLLLYGEE